MIGISFWLKGKKVVTAVNVADREKLRTKFLLGRKDLEGFLISARNNNQETITKKQTITNFQISKNKYEKN